MTPDRWARVKGVLADVLQVAPRQRSLMAERLCGGDQSLRDDVRGLLAADLDAGILDVPAEPAPSTLEPTAFTELGGGHVRVVGPYRLERLLGRGGMGEVYLATDLRLKRPVAVKLLSPRLNAEQRFAQQLLREARAVARLSHPNIAAVYDVIDEGGRVSLVMEYLPGESLATRLQRGSLPMRAVLEYGRQMAAALGHAHAHGLLHCDFKPANVILTADDRLKVLDFGLARTFAGAESDGLGASPSLILHRAGTPAYMAPEHRRGLPLGPPADVYALGIVLHEMATGHRPSGVAGLALPGSTTKTASNCLAVDASLPRALRAVVQRATMAEVLQRTQTAGEVFDELGTIGITRSLRLTPILLALILVAALSTGLFLWRQTPTSFQERDWAVVADFDDLTGEPALGRTVRQAFVIALQQSRFVNVLGNSRVADALSRMQRPADATVDEPTALEICRREDVRALIAGTLTRAGGTTQVTIRGIDGVDGHLLFVESDTFLRPDDLFTIVDGLARKIRRHLGEPRTRIDGTSAPLQKVTTRSFEALRRYSAAVDARARARMDDVAVPLQAALAIDPEFAMAHLKLGDYYLGIGGDTAKAIEHFARAHQLSDRVTERERHFIAASYFSAIERYDEARDSLRVLASLYPDDPDIRYELAMAHYSLEDLSSAISELREALRLNPLSTRTFGSLVLALAKDDRPVEAIEQQRRAASAKIDSPFLHWGGGLARLALSDVEGAQEQFRLLRAAGGYYDRLGLLQSARAVLFQGEFDEAFGLYEEALRASRAAGDVSLELVVRALRGKTHLLAGRREAARAEAGAILRAPASAVGAEDLRRSGSLSAQAGDLRLARAALARLDLLRRDTGGSFIDFAFHHVAGAVALAEDRPREALESFAAASAAFPWYESWQGTSHAQEALGQWQLALDERRRVLGVKGRILRDGFPLDWHLNHLAAARLLVRLGQCGQARQTAADTLTLLEHKPGAALGMGAHAALRELAGCRDAAATARVH